MPAKQIQALQKYFYILVNNLECISFKLSHWEKNYTRILQGFQGYIPVNDEAVQQRCQPHLQLQLSAVWAAAAAVWNVPTHPGSEVVSSEECQQRLSHDHPTEIYTDVSSQVSFIYNTELFFYYTLSNIHVHVTLLLCFINPDK